jgi:6,7-dimethyl-8-ribityllumazine synthase
MVPGSFEVPIAAKKLISSRGVDAVICLGCLIKGETVHFDYLAWEVTRGMDDVALSSGIPVTNGVLTVETVEQAMNRAGIKFGNKGSAAAEAAIEMAGLFRTLEKK